jgi:hypothetical protein
VGAKPDIQALCPVFCHSTAGIPPELTVPWTAFYDRVAAIVALPINENGDPKVAVTLNLNY